MSIGFKREIIIDSGLYDKMCRALTNYETNPDNDETLDLTDVAEDLYNALYDVIRLYECDGKQI